jgi:hypothetical protein
LDFVFVVISSIFQKEKYNLNNVTLFIEQYYPEYKYFNYYFRKNPLSNIIYRFYKKINNNKITISILPAYILTRKQKSIKIFFKLLKIYTEKKISIEKLYNFFDTSNHFKSLTTFKKYFSVLINQLDEILNSLTKSIVVLDSNNKYPNILPDKKSDFNKLKIMFNLITLLLKIIHELNIQIILESEIPYFLHYLIFSESKKWLLKYP